MKKILVVDVGGSNVKLMISNRIKRRKFASGPRLTPAQAVAQIKAATTDWDYEAVAIGFPAPVREGKIVKNPKHLGRGWAGFDFAKALGKPTRLINDAALQALGSYHGDGRMLFLGLGTGLGSALVWQNNVLPLELGDLPYQDEYIIEDWLGDEGLDQIGRKNWQRET
ncbi:MAG: ROK family protein, partial [Verrucomicrobiota bacterium]|nr:ROK family protein [Verrucomicrobiota bacterium]